jgi:hypothetical protein
MRLSGKISTICLALVLAVSLAAAANATAKKINLSSEIALQSVSPDGAVGHVSSGRRCRAQRQVSFYRVNSGPSVPSREPVTTTWTRGDGSWAVPGPLYPSEFFAVVQTKRAKGVVCQSATSNSLDWG